MKNGTFSDLFEKIPIFDGLADGLSFFVKMVIFYLLIFIVKNGTLDDLFENMLRLLTGYIRIGNSYTTQNFIVEEKVPTLLNLSNVRPFYYERDQEDSINYCR